MPRIQTPARLQLPIRHQRQSLLKPLLMGTAQSTTSRCHLPPCLPPILTRPPQTSPRATQPPSQRGVDVLPRTRSPSRKACNPKQLNMCPLRRRNVGAQSVQRTRSVINCVYGAVSCLRVDLCLSYHFPLSSAVFPSCPYSASPIVVFVSPPILVLVIVPPSTSI
jgi:hypothetical protein